MYELGWLGPGFPERNWLLGSRLVNGPKELEPFHDGEVQVAVSVTELERAIEAVHQGDAVSRTDANILLLGDLMADVLITDREVVGHAPRLGSGKQAYEIHVVGQE